MKKLLPSAAAAFALLGAAPGASAATQIGEYLLLTGFGTLGAVQTNSDEGKFGRDRQIGGADKTVSFDVDSNFGLQLTGTATSWLSATVQMLAAKRDGDHIDPRFEWAFVTVKPIDDLSIRAGRMAAPMFSVSDSRNVGYANTWVRAPNEVYALNLFRNMEAADITYNKSLGPVVLTATAFAGKTSFTPAPGLEATGKNLKGVNLLLDSDWGTFRYGWASATVTIPVVEPGDVYTFSGIGYTLDRDNVVVQSEYVKRKSSTKPTTINANGWYALGGYRFGKVLPYAIFSATNPETASSGTQKTTAIGVRWDAFRSAALKLQVDRIDTDNTKGISFTTPVVPSTVPGPPTYQAITKPVTAVSIALDFTF